MNRQLVCSLTEENPTRTGRMSHPATRVLHKGEVQIEPHRGGDNLSLTKKAWSNIEGLVHFNSVLTFSQSHVLKI